MPRPARSIWVPRAYARRRHRSWMLAMTLASLGWGTWWVALFLRRLLPGATDGWNMALVPSVLGTAFGVLGFLVALAAVRAQRSWILFVCVPLLANASLVFMPWLVRELAAHG